MVISPSARRRAYLCWWAGFGENNPQGTTPPQGTHTSTLGDGDGEGSRVDDGTARGRHSNSVCALGGAAVCRDC